MKALTSLMIVLSLLFATAAQAAGKSQQRIGGNVRYHAGQDTPVAAPFDDDVSYGVVYEYQEGGTFWQFAVSYADSMGSNDVDYVITPEINLMVSDGAWRGGAGVLASHISAESGSDWSDIYYQFILGLDIPLGALALSVQAYYVFDDFDGLSEFDFDEIEVSGTLMYRF